MNPKIHPRDVIELSVPTLPWALGDSTALLCDLCDEIPDIDDETGEYDLHQMVHVPSRADGSTQWWCSECAGIEKFGKVTCPDEFLRTDGTCQVCDE